MYNTEQLNFLGENHRYIWWMTKDECLEQPRKLLAQIMDLGTLEVTAKMESVFNKEELQDIVIKSVIGQFSPQSWSFWHRRLGLVEDLDPTPPLPVRPMGISVEDNIAKYSHLLQRR